MKTLACLALFAALAAGCDDDDPVTCTSPADCTQAGIPGVCLASPASGSHWCAFPDNSCASGDRWGVLAGDDLGSTCVQLPDAGPADAQVDANDIDGAPVPDAAPPVLTTKLVLAAKTKDAVYLYSPETLAPLATVTLPDRVGVGSQSIFVAGNAVWVTSVQDMTALDPGTLEVRAGYPKNIDATTHCTTSLGFVSNSGFFCPKLLAGTSNDGVEMYSLGSTSLQKTFPQADAFGVTASDTRVAVTYAGTAGGGRKFAAILDTNLTPVAGSPIQVDPGIDALAIDDLEGRIAVAAQKHVALFARSDLSNVGAHDFTADVDALAFDTNHHRVFAALTNGSVATISSVDGAVATAEVARCTGGPGPRVTFDASRDRYYLTCSTNAQLVVLDAETLEHVPGSPVTLPGAALSPIAF